MPYRRRYNSRSGYKRRYYKKRTFSRYNTYRHRSAKAQAYQIYKLNRKVSYVYKQSKPEVQIYQDPYNQPKLDLSLQSLSMSSLMVGCVDQNLGVFNGKYARIKNVVFNGSLQFDDNVSHEPQSTVCGVRLIFFRLKSEKWGFPSVSDIMPGPGFPEEYYVNCPLQPGFTTKYKLIRDKKIILHPNDVSSKIFKIKIKYPYSLCSSIPLETPTGSGMQNYPKNALFCCMVMCRYGGSEIEDQYSFQAFMKVAYTDDNYTNNSAKNVQTKNENVDNNNEDK